METQSEEKLFFQVIRNLFNGEAVLLSYTFSEYHWFYAVLYLFFVERFHFLEVYFLRWIVLFVCTWSQSWLSIIYFQNFILPGYVNKGSTVDFSSFFLCQSHINKVDFFSLFLSLRNIDQDSNSLLILNSLPKDHTWHEMPENVCISSGIMFLDFPKTVIEGKIFILSFFEFLENDILTSSGKNASTK